MKAPLLCFALLLCVASNAQYVDWGLGQIQPLVYKNARLPTHEHAKLSASILDLKGNVKSVSQKAFFIQEKKGANLKLGRPDFGKFFYYRFNAQQEIVEEWNFSEDTIPSEKKYFRNFKTQQLDSTIYPSSGYWSVYDYAPDGSLEKTTDQTNRVYRESVKIYHTQDSCCEQGFSGKQCFLKGQLVFEQGFDQFKILSYHPNGTLKSYNWSWFQPDTFPINRFEYSEQGQLLSAIWFDWDRSAKTMKRQTTTSLTYTEDYRIEMIKTVDLKNGVVTERISHFEYTDGRLVKIVHTSTDGKTETETILYNKHGCPIFEGTDYEYDQHGNWIKRFTFFDRKVEYRTIEYFD